MTSHAFEAALTQPTHDASYSQFCALISAHDYSGPSLPAVAENYLSAFCNSSLSSARRRWIGVALTGMLEKPDVATHIQKLREPLQDLGDVVLGSREREVTKIIAGMIIQKALEQGIEYRSFWSSEKVGNSAPTFPQEANATWMEDFQGFLNALGDLALTSTPSESSVRHFISLVTSDAFEVQEHNNGLPITILEDGILVLVAPDDCLQECQFVDVPVHHILSTRLEPSTLHASQSRRTKNIPCSLVMSLKTESWSYRLNSVERTANEMSIMFKHPRDALAWQESIEQHQKEQRAHPKMSRSLPINANSSSPQHNSLRRSSERSAIKESSKTSEDPLVPKSHPPPPLAAFQIAREAETTKSLSLSKRTTYGKGKLPIVSQATKQQALKQLSAQSDDVDIRAKNKGKEGTSSSTSSPASSHQKLSQHYKAAPGKKMTKSIKTRKSHVKRKVDDDDYVPEQIKSKKMMKSKRQCDFDTTEDNKQAKKPRVEPEGQASLVDVARKRRDRYRASVKPSTSVASSRHSLIGGLRGSQKPTEAFEVAFKKPTLPARVAQSPSTPTKPKKRSEEQQERLQTSRGAKTPMTDEVFAHMRSSPPIACAAEGRHERIQEPAVETEILSSNSKPIPASPNAESTAISGHADCDDVASEKQTGDSQTAKSDPFTRRSQGKMNTSFIRRLTGDELPNIASYPVYGVSHSATDEVRFSSTSEVEAVIAAIPLLAQPISGQQKRYSPSHLNPVNAEPCSHPDGTSVAPIKDIDPQNHPTVLLRSKQDVTTQTVGVWQRMTTPLQDNSGNEGEQIKQHVRQPFAALGVKEKHAESLELMEEDLPNTLLFTAEEVINKAPVEHVSHENDLSVEDHSLVGDCVLIQQHNLHLEGSSMQFHSSPPRTGSPSSHSSTSAESLSSPRQPLPRSQIEEMDWEASLEPHQRSLHGLLIRTSKRVMRHIVDNETSISEIADIFSSDGEHVLRSLMQRHEGDYERVFRGMESKREDLQMELERAKKHIVDERRRVDAMA